MIAIPENEDWEYHGIKPRDGRSFVCSSFVTAMYKAAGIIDKNIVPQEIEDRGLYMMNLFNTTIDRPQKCIDVDPDLPYCQILGKYRLDIPEKELSSLEIYDHMDERCPSIAPDYFRPDGC